MREGETIDDSGPKLQGRWTRGVCRYCGPNFSQNVIYLEQIRQYTVVTKHIARLFPAAKLRDLFNWLYNFRPKTVGI